MQGGYEVVVFLPMVLEGHSVPKGSLEVLSLSTSQTVKKMLCIVY